MARFIDEQVERSCNVGWALSAFDSFSNQVEIMAGYILSSLDSKVFTQLTSTPTRDQSRLIAEVLLDGLGDGFPEDWDSEKWPSNIESLADTVQTRLAASDWYSDMTWAQSDHWDGMLRRFHCTLGERLCLESQHMSDWGSIYWDCAEAAVDQGASSMAEPDFGNSGFRFSGNATSDYFPIYSVHETQKVQELLTQLEQIAPHFKSMGGEDAEEFLEGLLIPVRRTAEANRILWVQTDT